MPTPIPGRPGQRTSRMVLNLSDPASFDVVIKRMNARIRLTKTLKRWPDEIGKEIEQTILAKLIRELQQYPDRKPGMKIRWTSRKQQRYVMKLLKEQAKARGTPDDIGYQRTGRLREGWRYEVKANNKGRDAGIRVIVWNDARGYNKLTRSGQLTLGEPYQKFVMGSFGLGQSQRSIQRYQKPMQMFHKDRGWQYAYQKVQSGYQAMNQQALASWNNRMETIITQT